MKKNNIKKYLFYISLTPYLYVIIMSIFYAITGYGINLGNTAYGIDAMGNYLSDLFSDILLALFNPIIIIIAVLWISYQIYYFVSTGKDNHQNNNENKNESPKCLDLKKIFFVISVLCWITYFLSGIWAFFFGSNTGGGLFNKIMEYGMDAMLHTWFWNLLAFSLIPVLPVSLIYIIIYLVVQHLKNRD